MASFQSLLVTKMLLGELGEIVVNEEPIETCVDLIGVAGIFQRLAEKVGNLRSRLSNSRSRRRRAGSLL
jgi:hypothetical protein